MELKDFEYLKYEVIAATEAHTGAKREFAVTDLLVGQPLTAGMIANLISEAFIAGAAHKSELKKL